MYHLWIAVPVICLFLLFYAIGAVWRASKLFFVPSILVIFFALSWASIYSIDKWADGQQQARIKKIAEYKKQKLLDKIDAEIKRRKQKKDVE